MPHHRVHIMELSREIQSATISSKISTLRAASTLETEQLNLERWNGTPTAGWLAAGRAGIIRFARETNSCFARAGYILFKEKREKEW